MMTERKDTANEASNKDKEETKDESVQQEETVEPSESVAGEGPAEEINELELFQKKLEEAQKSAEAYKDQFLRKAAEFDNYKKRTDGERIELIKYANERLISQILPILDDFQRSMKAGSAKHDFDQFYKGIELVANKLAKVLETQGLKAFDSLGQPFNVDFHDALLQSPSADVPPNTVVEEVEKGYHLHDKVLRHAKVIVSSAPEVGADDQDGTGGEGTEEKKAAE